MSKGLVILDSGHAKNTAGKVAPDKSLYEWDFNNKMQYLLKKRLEDHKFKVCLTNPNPATVSDIPLSTRANKANEFYKSNGKPKTIMISLHANAYGEWTTARGVEVFHASNASQNSKNLAKYLCDQIYTDAKAKDSGFKNRGVKCEDFTVIYKTITPTCLIEYAFYTNREDLKLLKNEKDMFVEATVKAICKYFGITYVAPKKETSSTTNTTSKESTYYRVVTNSYLDRKLADKEVSELKKLGISAFLDAFNKEGKTYLRVIAGSYTDRKNADAQLTTLKKKGYDPFIAIYNK